MFVRNQPGREKGQILILSILAFTVVFIIGAIAVDIGLWLSERRGSQTDADFLALQGAWELLDPNATVGEVNAAVESARIGNDGEANLTLQSAPDVDLQERCVSVDVDHESAPLFFTIFGIADPEIGAHAKACAGPVSGGNLIPFQIDNDTAPCYTNEEPNYAELCPLELGAQNENPRGMLDLEAPDDFCSNDTGDGDIEDLIEWGMDGPCLINTSGVCPGAHEWVDCAATQTGNPKNVLDGTKARLARDGQCDQDGDGMDDFEETVILVAPDPGDPAQNIYSPRDCDPATDGLQMSPRLVTIIVFDEYPTDNNTPYPIVGLAGFYLAGCAGENQTVNSVDDLNRYCDDDYTTMSLPALSDLYVSAAPGSGSVGPLPVSHCPQPGHPGPHGGPNQAPCPTNSPTPTPTPSPGPATPTPTPTPAPVGSPGHAVVWGNFVTLLVAGGSPGGGGSSTTLGIYLVE